MIAKAKIRAEGVKLAAYLMKAAANEHSELLDMRGFGLAGDLQEGFRDQELLAEATNAEKPFFHVHFRGADGEGKKLSAAQWLDIANRCDVVLGRAMTQQPRGASLHIDNQTGDRHMHLAYSLVREADDGRFFVQKLGLYQLKLQDFAREIERDYGLTILSNERRDGARRGGQREHEESRRLGTDIDAIRSAILGAFQKSDNGKSFAAAMQAQGLELANGDRRDCFVVVDEAGGQHALNKKLTGMTLAAIRERLSDLDRSQLPGVEQAQALQAQRQVEREAREREKHGGRADAPGQANARTDGPQRAPQPEIKPLGQTAGEIRMAWQTTRNRDAAALAEDLEHRGLILVHVSADDAKASERAKDFAKAINRQNRALKEGFAVVDRRGTVTRIDQRTTGDHWEEIQKRLGPINRDELLTVTQARDVMKEANKIEFAERKRAEREQARPATKIEAAIIAADKAAGRDELKFADELGKAGIGLARVTAADVQALDALRKEQDLAAAAGEEPRRLAILAEVRDGDLCVVTRLGDVIAVNQQHMAALENRNFPMPAPAPATSTELVPAGDDAAPKTGDPKFALPSVIELRAGAEIDAAMLASFRSELTAARALDRDDAAARGVAIFESGQAVAQQREVLATIQDAKQGTIAAGAAAVEKGIHATTVVLSALASAVEGVVSFLGDLWASPSKPTELEAQIAPRVAAERAQEQADVAAYQENEAARDAVNEARAKEQNDERAAPEYFRLILRPGTVERDEGRERERER